MPKILKIIPVLILLFFIVPYLICPVYRFPETGKFHGGKIWNPYKEPGSDILNLKWHKCNFHLHAKILWGLINGRRNKIEDLFRVYGMLGYDVVSIANYMSIAKAGFDKSCNIPVYEHGFGIQKTHQLCIGSRRALWFDYPFYQGINQKQFIIDLLAKQNELVSLAHPALFYGYSINDMKQLTGYGCVEVLNHFKNSEKNWDAALSSGHIAYIEAGDDTHDISNSREVGRCFTMVGAESMAGDNIVEAMRKGRSYGVVFSVLPMHNEPYEQKASRSRMLPSLKSVNVQNDVLTVSVSEKARDFKFIGQGGVLKKTVQSADSASCEINPDDAYVRTEITFVDGTSFYLNPVFRYDGDKPDYSMVASVDIARTIIYRGILLLALIALIFFYFKSVYKISYGKTHNEGILPEEAQQ